MSLAHDSQRFAALVHGRTICAAVLRLVVEKAAEPTAVILDGRTLQSTCESGSRAGYEGYKAQAGLQSPPGGRSLGHLLALRVTPSNEQERAQVGALLEASDGREKSA